MRLDHVLSLSMSVWLSFCISWVTLFVSFSFDYPVKCTWGFVSFWVRVCFLMGHCDLRTVARSHWLTSHDEWPKLSGGTPVQKHYQSGSTMGREVKEGDKGEEEEWWEHQAKIKRSVCSAQGVLGRLLTMHFSSV